MAENLAAVRGRVVPEITERVTGDRTTTRTRDQIRNAMGARQGRARTRTVPIATVEDRFSANSHLSGMFRVSEVQIKRKYAT